MIACGGETGGGAEEAAVEEAAQDGPEKRSIEAESFVGKDAQGRMRAKGRMCR